VHYLYRTYLALPLDPAWTRSGQVLYGIRAVSLSLVCVAAGASACSVCKLKSGGLLCFLQSSLTHLRAGQQLSLVHPVRFISSCEYSFLSTFLVQDSKLLYPEFRGAFFPAYEPFHSGAVRGHDPACLQFPVTHCPTFTEAQPMQHG
jgi:hypothetical protein